ncbi:hypothetical protein FQA47_016032 [Oryzias melastigma]|uniref:Uncharacterized protein n=1 Tax=Oryzias melastigma TaxID=30732 RepID=A0A834FN64_ORYME|nr:hypothetical protein FQA47_016032 [Oryzias melastigma]
MDTDGLTSTNTHSLVRVCAAAAVVIRAAAHAVHAPLVLHKHATSDSAAPQQRSGARAVNQKFRQQSGGAMSHSQLVSSIPYHSHTTMYSQNQDPPPYVPTSAIPPSSEGKTPESQSGLHAAAAAAAEIIFPLPSISVHPAPFCLHFFGCLPAPPPLPPPPPT